MAYRFVGVLSLMFGLVVILCAIQQHRLSQEMADPAIFRSWTGAARGAFLVKGDITGVSLGLCGVGTIAGAFGMIFRRRWGMASLLVAAAFPILYAPLTRVLAPAQYRMDRPALPDLFFGCVVAVLAAWAFAVRPRKVDA
jgi:hypothetical protein